MAYEMEIESMQSRHQVETDQLRGQVAKQGELLNDLQDDLQWYQDARNDSELGFISWSCFGIMP